MTCKSDTQNYASEFLTGHFGYTPLALVDDYVNHFNEPVGGIMDAIEDFFVAILAEQGLDIDSDGKFQNEVRGGIHRLQTLLEHLIDKNVDKLEIYLLRNILTIPAELGCTPTAFLPHYRALDVADGDEESTHVGMAALEEKRDELAKVSEVFSSFILSKSVNTKTARENQSQIALYTPYQAEECDEVGQGG